MPSASATAVCELTSHDSSIVASVNVADVASKQQVSLSISPAVQTSVGLPYGPGLTMVSKPAAFTVSKSQSSDSATAVSQLVPNSSAVVPLQVCNKLQHTSVAKRKGSGKSATVRQQKKSRKDTEMCGSCGFCYGDSEDPLIEDDWAVCQHCCQWFHESCGSIGRRKLFTCNLCLPSST